ncbi:hypothetical protein BQ1740_4234 [Bacillus subtilis]|nr:hypothetical protein BQ1740_4234 [Bacillus subtilis]
MCERNLKWGISALNVSDHIFRPLCLNISKAGIVSIERKCGDGCRYPPA